MQSVRDRYNSLTMLSRAQNCKSLCISNFVFSAAKHCVCGVCSDQAFSLVVTQTGAGSKLNHCAAVYVSQVCTFFILQDGCYFDPNCTAGFTGGGKGALWSTQAEQMVSEQGTGIELG